MASVRNGILTLLGVLIKNVRSGIFDMFLIKNFTFHAFLQGVWVLVNSYKGVWSEASKITLKPLHCVKKSLHCCYIIRSRVLIFNSVKIKIQSSAELRAFNFLG